MPVRMRLALIVAAGLAVLLAGSGLAFVDQLRDSLTAAIDASLWSRHDAVLDGPRDHAAAAVQDGTQVLTAGDAVAAQSADDIGARPLLTAADLARARRGPLWLTRSYPGISYPVRLLAFPLPGRSRGVVGVVSSSTSLRAEAVNRVEEGFLFGGPVVVVLGALAGWLLAGAALRPVERMRRQAAGATTDGGGPVLDVPGTRDELAALAQTLNGLLGRLRAAVARERTFVADAGHELRTPLSILRAELELAGKPGRTRAELAEAVCSAAGETDRLVRLAEGLLLLAREQDGQFLHRERTDVQNVLETAVAGLGIRARASDAHIRVDVRPPGLTATWDPDRIRQVVLNLVGNALRYNPPGGTVRVTASGFADRIVLRIQDEGPGFPDDFLPHAFERFTRADPSRGSSDGGAGLGLSIVGLIACAHGGSARAGNRPGGGAEVTVETPEPA